MSSRFSPPSSPREPTQRHGTTSAYDDRVHDVDYSSASPVRPSAMTESMGPPTGGVARSGSSASRASGYQPTANYASMGNAGVLLQQPQSYAQPAQAPMHPPSKLATGGQSHAHRPVSAMPTPTDRGSNAGRGSKPTSDGSANVFASMGPGYNERRASAHPTMSSSSSHAGSGAMGAPPLPGNGAGLDPGTSQAISSGIPITSPAALSYFAAHPRRQQVHFGNYLLLQTLGEGEFGKVKLGVHKEWGEEVAVKLIKREKVGPNGVQLQLDPNQKDPAKMSKVEREIQVLKDVRHPNIVRLYEVIESDRYIGIVLEYASGGELFDHILAHKYLKEEHACRLFAQLISGVSYLHRKKIVHRDLKLENLLLDRNRNVIITDFGFANNFEDRRDDLMATSCGSPCYAAPELVVQDGLYAGSAVDVWSCGVILYAMLAGYLPFDDDPANPDGDNINLLYKYIMATPLSFPDYISAEPRDLLSRMLVPDPLKRADLNQVMSHSWLSAYRDLFRFSVDDLERAAVEQQTKKRQVYRQQMLYQHQLQEQQRRQQMERSQSTKHVSASLAPSGAVGITDHPHQAAKAQRHQSAMASSTTMPDRIFEAAPGTSGSSLSVPGARVGSESGRSSAATAIDPVMAQGNARGEPRTRLDESAPAATASSRKRDSAGASRDSEQRKPAASKTQRHTIQLEYSGDSDRNRAQKAASTTDGSVPPVPRVTHDRAAPTANTSATGTSKPNTATSRSGTASAGSTPAGPREANGAISEASQAEGENAAPIRAREEMARTASTASSGAGVPSPILEQGVASAMPSTAEEDEEPKVDRPKASQPRMPSAAPAGPAAAQAAKGAASRGVSNPLPSSEPVSFPPGGERVASAGAAASPEKRSRRISRPSTSHLLGSSSKATPERTNSRHRKGMSTDKFFLSRLLGSQGGGGASSPGPRAGDDTDSRSQSGSTFEVSPARPAVDRTPSSNGRSGSRRKAMSLVVGKPGNASSAARDRDRAIDANGAAGTRRSEMENVSEATSSGSAEAPAAPSLRGAPSVASSRPPTATSSRHGTFYDESTLGSSASGPSSNAAKKVMDWFRKKSLSRGGFQEQPPLGPFERSPSQVRANSPGAPQVVVTGAAAGGGGSSSGGVAGSSVPSSRSTSGTHSQASEATEATQVTAITETSQRTSEGVKSSASTVQQATPKASSTMMAGPETPIQPSSPAAFGGPRADLPFVDSRLRFHLGAVDQSALTSRSPIDVFAEVQRALYDMGIDVRKERDEDFKLECVRRKRAKTLFGATQGLSASIRTSVFPPSQADVERSSRTSNVAAMSTSPSTGGGSLRSFLRRGSQAQPPGSASPVSGSAFLSPSSTTTPFEEVQGGNAQAPQPLYGDASVDGGQEIRFSVEVTRIKNLPGLYSLDIRRMKGNLWAYKFVYCALLDRCQLGGGSSNPSHSNHGSPAVHANNGQHAAVLQPGVAV
ncbi:uncharacterized protein PFL1_01625 [Pseudozyma flocculosa PF-1]|uniref:Related to Serine/threonine protein kinase n=1 Tax=Pseudozyma flocculosa TaxID=84751 RepID=A0A5C3EXH7_9BASI|nr:uncharacterized protein PFL1_01625 [Pseudozyma flocculosa PF-1]EPQ30724.1 hypothetical protein PFL1_01625 [Pseudozyma flocculosa PF-1]SPO36928.1 related to Serine/threonine protein kinase [Pseudozyma flocculosa]